MVTQLVPNSIRSQLSGTIVESAYREIKIRTTELTKAEYYTPVGSFEMLVPEGHPFLVKSGPDGEEHEPVLDRELKNNLKEDTIFYDIGARFGYHTRLLMELGLTEEQIHGFEGNKLAFWVLQQNHGPAAKLTKAYISDGDSGLSLDKYISEHTSPDIIKIDVEGAELEVLRGLENNLDNRMLLYIEIHPEMMGDFGDEPSELIQLLHKHGYELQVTDHRQDQEELISLSQIEDLPSDNYLIKAH